MDKWSEHQWAARQSAETLAALETHLAASYEQAEMVAGQLAQCVEQAEVAELNVRNAVGDSEAESALGALAQTRIAQSATDLAQSLISRTITQINDARDAARIAVDEIERYGRGF